MALAIAGAVETAANVSTVAPARALPILPTHRNVSSHHHSFGSTVGQFCLLAGLRAQIAPGRDQEFKEVSQER